MLKYNIRLGDDKEAQEWDEDFDSFELNDIQELWCDLADFDFNNLDDVIDELAANGDYIVRYGNELYGLIA